MPLWPLVLAGALGAALFFSAERDASPSSPPPSNLVVRERAKLSPLSTRFVTALARRVGPDVPVIVGAGLRSHRVQARAITYKIEAGDDLYETYSKRYAREMLEAYPDIEAMAAVSRRHMKPGGHGSGHAVDLNTTELTPRQRNAVMAAALELGASVLWEKPGGGKPPVPGVVVVNASPDHLHIGQLQKTRFAR